MPCPQRSPEFKSAYLRKLKKACRGRHCCSGRSRLCPLSRVEAGADVNAQTSDSQNRTPLHIAKLLGFPNVANYLMAHGVILPRPAPISAKLAAADAEKGRMYFESNCANCHSSTQQGRRSGPNLWNVVGRDKAALSEAGYSEPYGPGRTC
jgi:cytochrome c